MRDGIWRGACAVGGARRVCWDRVNGSNLNAECTVELAEELLASLDGDSKPNVDAAWGEEIERRARRAIDGETDAESWEIVRARALEKIGRQ